MRTTQTALLYVLLVGCATSDDFAKSIERDKRLTQERIEVIRPTVESRARQIQQAHILRARSGSELGQALAKVGMDGNAIDAYVEAVRLLTAESKTFGYWTVPSSSRPTLEQFVPKSEADRTAWRSKLPDCERHHHVLISEKSCPGARADSILRTQENLVLLEASMEQRAAYCRVHNCAPAQTPVGVASGGRVGVRIPIDISSLAAGRPDNSQASQLRRYGLELAAWRRALELIAFPGVVLDFRMESSGCFPSYECPPL